MVHEKQRYTKQIRVWLTPDQYEELSEKAKEANLSLSALARKLLTEGAVVFIVRPKWEMDLLTEIFEMIQEIDDALQELVRQVRRSVSLFGLGLEQKITECVDALQKVSDRLLEGGNQWQ